jgi:hypothetical protein
MSVTKEVQVISALTGPSTLGDLADRVGVRQVELLATLQDLIDEGTVKRQGNLFWLAKHR